MYRILLILIVLASSLIAEEKKEDKKSTNRILVLSDKELLKVVGGSATLLDEEDLKETKGNGDDVHQTLKKVPGVNILEEEGYGLRPNISFRGTPPERSRTVTIMEDGVLKSPAAYTAPSAYIFPTFGRMEGLEILKGASQIKYGPQTIGGSLNMLSAKIPEDQRIFARIEGGEDSFLNAHAKFGQGFENGGFLLQAYDTQTDGFKKLDSGGDTGFDLTDLMGKFQINTDKTADVYQELEFKINDMTQDSDETYLGLTEDDFRKDPYRRYSATQNDKLDISQEAYQVRHYIQPTESVDLTTILYRTKSARNWYKLDKVGGIGLADIMKDPVTYADPYSWLTGMTSPDDSLVIRGNNRRYDSKGVQSVLGVEFDTGSVGHTVEIGARYHEDEEDRFQAEDSYRMEDGTMVRTKLGAPGSQENRIGDAKAWAFFLQDTLQLDKLTLIPGVRYELIDYRNRDFGKLDPTRSGTALSSSESEVDVILPGLGATYGLTDSVLLVGGIHKGFAPPGPQATSDIKEEESINYEAGLRYDNENLSGSLIGFLNDYDNLLGADTLAAGGTGSGNLFNAGEARSYGVETGIGYDIGKSAKLSVGLPVYVSYTYTNAEFRDSFDSSLFGSVTSGDKLPYIAENLVSVGVGVDYEKFKVRLDGHFTDEMPVIAGRSGLRTDEKTDDHWVFDLGASYEVAEGTRVFSKVRNLFDEEYVAARRPAGARPGLPTTVFAGIEIDL